MKTEVKVIEDSINSLGDRVTTIVATYPRYIHAEVMTHRVFSRNASSSRAIPFKKQMKKTLSEMVIPEYWGKNQSGMQAYEKMSEGKAALAKLVWVGGGYAAAGASYLLNQLGAHKQLSNRLMEPWAYITVIITSTKWNNFLELRDHHAAQPEIQDLARKVRYAINHSVPKLSGKEWQSWHMPFVTPEERMDHSYAECVMMSVARCARVSYMNHEGGKDIEKDIQLYGRLVGSKPIHGSAAEHTCEPVRDMEERTREGNRSNLKGWIQHRKTLVGEDLD